MDINHNNPQQLNNDNENNPKPQLPFCEVYSFMNLMGYRLVPKVIERMRKRYSLDESHKFENSHHILGHTYYRYVTRFKKTNGAAYTAHNRINLGPYDPINIADFAASPLGKTYRVMTNNGPLDNDTLLALRYPHDVEPYNEVYLIHEAKCMGRLISKVQKLEECEHDNTDINILRIEKFEIIGTITNEYRVENLGLGNFLSFFFSFFFLFPFFF